MLQHLRSFIMLIAMVLGAILYKYLAPLNFVTPYIIFAMLFITLCKVNVRQMRISGLHFMLLVWQIVATVGVYMLIKPFDEVLAQGAMICAFSPVAMAAVVIGGMLGANVTVMATYTLICNLGVALISPILFSYVGVQVDMPFWESFVRVISKVFPLLLLPFILSQICRWITPKVSEWFVKNSVITFYLWASAILITTAQTVKFMLEQNSSSYRTEALLAIIALVMCVLQFVVGWRIGTRYGDRVAGGQSLGQKNNVLAIWLAQSYLNPLTAIAPAAYVVWQNIINSYQLYRQQSRADMAQHEVK